MARRTDHDETRTIRFGATKHRLAPRAGECVALIEPATPAPTESPRARILAALESPIGGTRLRELAKGKKTAAILIPGIDRVACAEAYVPALIAELTEGGIPAERITIHLATGTHEHKGQTDLVQLLGETTCAQVAGIAHNCRSESDFRQIGTTKRGTPVQFHRQVLEADLKVLTGRIIPHYFAGYSGGRKTLLPGVAHFRSIVANHRLTLDTERGIHPAVACGSLEGNPVHEDMVEAADLVGGTYCLNTLMDADHRLVDAVAGPLAPAHAEGCARARRMFERTVSGPVDALVSSAGGDPYDCNFMQSLKAAFNVQELVRDGGAFLWIAACPGGIHPGFLEWAKLESDDALETRVRESYNLTGHNSIMLRRLTRRLKVALWSQLPAETVRALGLHPVSSLEEGLAWIERQCPPDFRYAVVPFANVTHARVSASET